MSTPQQQSSPQSASIRRNSTATSLSSEGGSQHAELYYWPSVFVIVTSGLLNLVFTLIGGVVGAVWALSFAVVLVEWVNLHSDKLTRRERTFFDEMNILETSKAFEFNLGPVLEDTTPGGTGGCCGPYPKASGGLVSSLFRDEREDEMQKFYREHYGGMHSTAKRAEHEQKMRDQSEDENKKN